MQVFPLWIPFLLCFLWSSR